MNAKMKSSSVVPDLIKAWGVQKFLEGVTIALRKMGRNENLLASDIDQALSRYVNRQD